MLVWTNAAFLPAALVAWHKDLFFAAFAYTCLLLASALYHAFAEKRFSKLDRACAYTVMGWNTYVFITCFGVLSVAGAVFAAIALCTYALARQHSYRDWHSVWHVLSGCAGLSFVLAA